jgi:hypothetical protein
MDMCREEEQFKFQKRSKIRKKRAFMFVGWSTGVWTQGIMTSSALPLDPLFALVI